MEKSTKEIEKERKEEKEHKRIRRDKAWKEDLICIYVKPPLGIITHE